MPKTHKLYTNKLADCLRHPIQTISIYWRKGLAIKIKLILLVILILLISTMYAIARWYIYSESSKPLNLGVSFIPDYAQSLGVDPEANLKALLGIKVKQYRLVSYWSDIEPSPGQFDFTQLDWQFKDIQAARGKIILNLGLRQPRWPECHLPNWAESEPASVWQPELNTFIAAVVNRYKDSPSLISYQLENEYFLKGFGDCTNFSRSRLISEYNIVKSLDPNKPIILGRSNNAVGIPIGNPTPDLYSISIYKRVWDAGFSHRYLEYPFPAWYYGFLAGLQRIIDHRDMMIGELQAEAWPPNGKTIPETSLSEQNKSMNAKRLTARFKYGEATGMRNIDLWGAEYWYYRLTVLHDPSLWNVAKQEFQNPNQ